MTFQCCFCGEAILDSEIFLIEIRPPSPRDWCQSVYSHKQCLAAGCTPAYRCIPT